VQEDCEENRSKSGTGAGTGTGTTDSGPRDWFSEVSDLDSDSENKLAASVGNLVSMMQLYRVITRMKTAWRLDHAKEGEDLVELGDTVLDGMRQQALKEQEQEQIMNEQRDCTGCIPPEPIQLNGKSLWIFGSENQLRVVLSKVVEHPIFENLILCLIIASSVTLALEEPGMDEESTLAKNLFYLDFIFTSIFTLEMVAKVIVLGFMFEENAYLRSGFNILDFIIVLVSLLSITGMLEASALRALRTFRALKPLRTIKRAPGLRCVVEAIMRCMPGFINIALVSSVCYLIFAILGVQFWAGRFWRCTDDTVAGVSECVGTAADGTPREWQNAPINFDNVPNGMLTLFEVASMELWLDVMHNAMDAPSEIGVQPSTDQHWWASLYFVVFIVIGSFLIMNLFVGAVVDTFNTVKTESAKSATMTENQMQFVSSMKEMLSNKPQRALVPLDGDSCLVGLRRRCFHLCTNAYFDTAVMILITANVLVMSLFWWEMPRTGVLADSQQERELQETPWNSSLTHINTAFTALFVMEATLKLFGFGCGQYFSSGLNIFDFFVVSVSVIGFVFELVAGSDNTDMLNILLIFRAARVMRIFRLTVRFSGVKRLMETLMFTLPSLLNVTMLLVLVLFIFTILGMNFFGLNKISTTSGYNHYGLYTEHANFRTFWKGFFTLFRMSTGESWNGIMHDVMEESGDSASLFFVLYMIVGSSLLFNLVIAILLDEFSSRGQSDGFIVTPDDLDNFTKVWSKYDPEATLSIPLNSVPLFVLDVGEPLGAPAGSSLAAARMTAVKLAIPITNGKANFVETFCACAREALQVETLDAEVLAEVMSSLHKQFPQMISKDSTDTDKGN